MRLTQDPAPGKRLLRFAGDLVTFTLVLDSPAEGRALLRTNLGHGDITRREIIREVEKNEPALARDWFDVPMARTGRATFSVTVPVVEPGHFQAKCLFVQDGRSTPWWPEGDNTVINACPARSVAGNSIYNAFVRQFGPAAGARESLEDRFSQRSSALDAEGFTVIPPSGTFRDLAGKLPFILSKLGCSVLQLLPVHPTPTTYGRMGRFGSPYASLSFSAVDPALAVFDPSATPMEQFQELADAVHAGGARLILDMAVSHTGWAAELHESHPEWLVRGPDGKIQAPGAWGVIWADLTRLDYSHKDLWEYMADVFLLWCKRGVDGFRADAGYMIPVKVWRYITARVREQYPDTIFFLEGLGGKVSVTRAILNEANFDWAYSELFQNYDRSQIEWYLPSALSASETDGLMVHFAETHDNNRLAERSKTWARMRTALCALFSVNGAFAFANGVEWFATQKIDVHGAKPLNWGARVNQVAAIRRLNRILSEHPAFHDGVRLFFCQKGPGNFACLARVCERGGKRVFILANLDDGAEVRARFDPGDDDRQRRTWYDLLSGKTRNLDLEGGLPALILSAGEVLCLSPDRGDLKAVAGDTRKDLAEPSRSAVQRLRQTVLSATSFYHPDSDLAGLDLDASIRDLVRDPLEFCRSMNTQSQETRAVSWQWPRDAEREVMVPPRHFLLVFAPNRFSARIMDGDRALSCRESHEQKGGGHFALFPPLAAPRSHASRTLEMTVFGGKTVKKQAPLLFLAPGEQALVERTFGRGPVLSRNLLVLGVNGRGGMMRANARWGELASRYDALLAANPDPDTPVDRRVALTRCRGWVVYQGYSHEIAGPAADAFCAGYGAGGFWRFFLPSGQGEHVAITAHVSMLHDENAVRLTFLREKADHASARLPDKIPVRLVLRPDVEDRSFHEVTKAYTGPEHSFPASVSLMDKGFVFAPGPGGRLCVSVSSGRFFPNTEWSYMVRLSEDEARGHDPMLDLFSPGYFTAELHGGESCQLVARYMTGPATSAKAPCPSDAPEESVAFPRFVSMPVGQAMDHAMDQYLVKRQGLSSVIAGFPWFLDWGRDSLIFCRGLIAAGKTRQAISVLGLFGQYEDGGTLPNAIFGADVGNRETSDAPLWFAAALGDIAAAEGMRALAGKAGSRKLSEILLSIVENIYKGARNKVRMDPDSGLVHSPAHYTWMDTNFPAATPREGYPVEIQALWINALRLAAAVAGKKAGARFENLAAKASSSLASLYYNGKLGYLVDCLHASRGTPAAKAQPDDCLRPNQILAVTLGAVTDRTLMRKIVAACECLLVPGGIRSLADRPVERPVPVEKDGRLLNDPVNPYWGRYEGDEDTRRKPAYHNGTAWTWLFPSWCEALVRTYGEPAREAALAYLGSASRLISRGAVGHVPEILDGSFPHTPRGCDAQAWSASELYRVWKLCEGGKGQSQKELSAKDSKNQTS
ncbi:MAG: amylo-alpha-1,6-glucosidase [Thermodesulfobacteriota bacterium]